MSGALIVRGSAFRIPLRDGSVDLVVTSPGYWALRDYGTGHPDEVGSEGHWRDWLAHMVAATAEMTRVLKPSGSIFVNLGDKYAGGGGYAPDAPSNVANRKRAIGSSIKGRPVEGMPPKSLLLLPERYRIACVDELGLTARAVIVWDKPNCLSGGARVYARLTSGDRPIMVRDLFRAYRPEDVQLWNGHHWTQVLNWVRTPDDDGALELEFRSGERIGCTPEHRWPTTQGLKRADELRVGDVVLATALPEPDQPRQPAGLLSDDLREDIGWLVGLYIAEGSRSETTIQIAGHLGETERHERLARIARDYDGTCNVYQTSENGSTCNLRGSVLLGIIDQYVSPGTAKTKRLRKAAWQRDNQFLAGVVKGYLHGDGHYDAKNDRWRVGFTANDEWAADLRTLAARLGAQFRLRRRVTTFDGRSFPGWGGDWRWQRTVHWNSKADTEIVAIRRSRARDFYDIGVQDDPHLFALASGALTHNSLPESVRDRVRRSHEDWVHLTKGPRYYSAIDEIREASEGRAAGGNLTRTKVNLDGTKPASASLATSNGNPLGKLPGSVWSVPSEPLRLAPWLGVDHYAAFPSEWPRRLILGWSPPGICQACGQGRFPVVERDRIPTQAVHNGRSTMQPGRGAGANWEGYTVPHRTEATILGYACACTPSTLHPGTGGTTRRGYSPGLRDNNAQGTYGRHQAGEYEPAGPWREYHLDGWKAPPTRPALVLDPFMGTGTTLLVARALGRHAVGVDLSAAYTRLATWRVWHSGHAAKATVRTNRERQGQLVLDADP